jgi:hypothetical protein
MGRKSSSKAQNRDNPPGPPEAPKSASPGVMAGVVVLIIGIAGFVAYSRSSSSATAAATAADQAKVDKIAQTPGDAPWAKFGPRKQTTLPPLPVQGFPPPRPMETVRAAYLFAAEHPEVLSYVPCFCGCERGGHKGNEDCFVARRDANGDVTEWEPHGLDCAVCIDVAVQAMQMHASGANVRDIRSAVEAKWASFKGGHTPTPTAPQGHTGH